MKSLIWNKHGVVKNDEEEEEDDANSENQAKVEEAPSKAKASACNFCEKHTLQNNA